MECLNPWDVQSARQYSINGVYPTLQARESSGGQNTGMVYSIQGNVIDRPDGARCNGSGWNSKSMYTLNTIDRHAVVYPTVARTLTAEADASPYVDRGQNIVVMASGQANAEIEENLSPTLTCYHEHTIIAHVSKPPRRYIVRRLTPLECCRLQGFPDGWGEIDRKDSFTDEEAAFWQGVRATHAAITGGRYTACKRDTLLKWYNGLHTDSAEYKMWGNGIALPCARYVMEGIAKEE